MKKIIIWVMTILFLVALVVASDFTPQGNINLRDTYNITNAPEYNGTDINITGNYYGNGSELTGITITSANSSDYWDNYNTATDLNNLVEIAGENVTSGTIGFARLPSLDYLVLVKWNNITDAPTALSFFTDDLGDRGYTHLSNFTNDEGFTTNASALAYVNSSGLVINWSGIGDTNTNIIDDNLYNSSELEEQANGKLGIINSWFTSFINSWFGGKDTDDLTEGSTNLYDNQSWNEGHADTLYIGTGDETNLNVNSSDYWDNFDIASDLNNLITIDWQNITNIVFTDFNNKITLKQENITNEDWIEDSQEGNLNVNSSDYWDDLDTPSDINAGDITDDGTYLITTGDTATGNYTFDTDTLHVDSTNGRVGIGTASPKNPLNVVGDGNFTDDLFIGDNVDAEGNITADYFIGDGSQLTGITDNDNWNTTEEMQDAVLNAGSNGDGVDITYDDVGNSFSSSFDCSDVDGTGLSCSGEDLILTNDFGSTISEDELASTDFGDFTCDGTDQGCSLDGSYLQNVVEDTTPSLGGYLDTNTNDIGSSTDEIEDVYVATNSKIYFGDGQETSIHYNGSALIIG